MKKIIASLIMAIPVTAFAAVPNTFKAGDTATAEAFNENFENLDSRVEAIEEAAKENTPVDIFTYEPSGLEAGDTISGEFVDNIISTQTLTLSDGGTITIQAPDVSFNAHDSVSQTIAQTLMIDGVEFNIHSQFDTNGERWVKHYKILMAIEDGFVQLNFPANFYSSPYNSSTRQLVDDYIDHIRVTVEPAQ